MPDFVKAGYWICGSRYFTRSVKDLPSELFTHLYAGFAEVNANDGRVTVPEKYEDQFRNFTNTVRERSHGVKTLLSIGGEGSHISTVVADPNKRQAFIRTSIDLASDFHFDGLDLCWLYPNSPTDNPENLKLLLEEWRRTATDSLLLTAAVYHHPVIPPSPIQEGNNVNFNYPCQAISENLDWINVLSIDFYTPSKSPGETGPVHGWRTRSTEPTKCGSHGIGSWINTEIIHVQKLVLGLPFYGYKWILDNPNICESIFALAHPATDTHPISYRNIPPSPRKHNKYYVASYVQNEGSWYGFDDECDISTKVREAIVGRKLRGYSAWNVNGDDEKWTLSNAAYNAANAVNP
ncbi:hypothetical protein F2P56_013641 [Juglans regia]|uniref:GH18 domain-containing protein n=2 Tax=Juglans regia TaxID=51240 RepID=A0A833XJZ1_JUGRE|nr:class V chitinase-like [Juglans regia]KAF5469577.1 hypothetical protein F2P56_013641 [Juglans regia]